MARRPRATDNIGRDPLTEEEQSALVTYFALKIIEDQRKLAAAKSVLDGCREVVNGHFKRMTADLKFTRKEFEAEVLENMNKSEAEYVYAEKKRARLHRLAGLQKGEQLDLIDKINDTVDDEIEAEANGYRAGRRGDDPTPPETTHPMFLVAFERGYRKGVEENGALLAKAGKILEARSARRPELRADDDGKEGAGGFGPTEDEEAIGESVH